MRLSAVAQFASHNLMDDIARSFSPESSAADVGKWIGRVVIAVILAEGIWGFIVSITNYLVLPLLARTMGGDVQSPLYLGKGDFNVPALFGSILELCFAGIAAVMLNSWIQRKPRLARVKSVRVSPIPARPAAPLPPPPVVTPVQAAIPAPPPIPPVMMPSAPVPSPPAPAASTQPGQFWSPTEASPQPQVAAPPPPKAPAKPQKPKPPKEVYYNIVGEPINPTEDD
jgi:hypothetical protein